MVGDARRPGGGPVELAVAEPRRPRRARRRGASRGGGGPRHAAAAGFRRVRVDTADVPAGLATPAELVSWRLGMAHMAPFMRSLDAPGRAAVRRAAEQAVAAVAGPLVVSMVVLTALSS